MFWPWLWLQLAFLLALKDQDGRERLIMVSAWGQVIVLALGDDPHAPKGWGPEDLRDYVRPLRDRLCDLSANARVGGYPGTGLCTMDLTGVSVHGHPSARVPAAKVTFYLPRTSDPPWQQICPIQTTCRPAPRRAGKGAGKQP